MKYIVAFKGWFLTYYIYRYEAMPWVGMDGVSHCPYSTAFCLTRKPAHRFDSLDMAETLRKHWDKVYNGRSEIIGVAT